MASQVLSVATMVESQALNAIVAGFSFASAVAWMDVIRWVITQMISLRQNGGSYYVLTALATTVLAVIVFMIIKAVAINVEINQPSQVYAVTR
jgi:hypothetical protein